VEEGMISERIREFLAQQFPATRNINNEGPLLKSGLIDSLGILEVVTFLEKEFGITVSDEELLPENFASVRSLSKFVQQKNNRGN
jgi:acyl carrier protein